MGPGTLQQWFNGTYRFSIDGASGACTSKFFGPPPTGTHSLPWSFVVVDTNATFNRTEHNYDGFKDVGVWYHQRPARHVGPGMIPAQEMEWRIENTSTTAEKEFLSSTCIQSAFPPSPPGLMQSGVRDFHGNYTTPAPAGSFSPPDVSKCKVAPGPEPFVPDNGCKPACGPDALCCRDPNLGPGNGTCFGVKKCSSVHGEEQIAPFLSSYEEGELVFG